MDICKATLVGNVGRDPELRYTPAGKPILNFSVACNRVGPPSPDGERQQVTEWFNVICFNRLAEVYNNLVSKGSKVYVEGRLQTRSYETREGQTRHVVEVVANDVLLLSPRNRPENVGASMGGMPMAAVPVGADHDNLDDVPF
jgi:single-strand DNA-binding protein